MVLRGLDTRLRIVSIEKGMIRDDLEMQDVVKRLGWEGDCPPQLVMCCKPRSGRFLHTRDIHATCTQTSCATLPARSVPDYHGSAPGRRSHPSIILSRPRSPAPAIFLLSHFPLAAHIRPLNTSPNADRHSGRSESPLA